MGWKSKNMNSSPINWLHQNCRWSTTIALSDRQEERLEKMAEVQFDLYRQLKEEEENTSTATIKRNARFVDSQGE